LNLAMKEYLDSRLQKQEAAELVKIYSAWMESV